MFPQVQIRLLLKRGRLKWHLCSVLLHLTKHHHSLVEQVSRRVLAAWHTSLRKLRLLVALSEEGELVQGSMLALACRRLECFVRVVHDDEVRVVSIINNNNLCR